MPLTYTSSTTFTCPPDVTSIRAECWGAGGGASGNFNTVSNGKTGGSGGGGGAYTSHTFTALPSTDYTLNVGASGVGGTVINSGVSNPGNGGTGGDTSVVDHLSAIKAKARGGVGGVGSAGGPATGGAGGTTIGSYDTEHAGGSGANSGVHVSTPSISNGGGGGSSGGTALAGVNGSGITGGVAPSGGGNGGGGGNSSGNPGNAGSVPGGGAGGPSAYSSDSLAGATGQIKLYLVYSVSLSDSLVVGEVANTVYSGSGSDSATISEKANTVYTGTGSESLTVGESNSRIVNFNSSVSESLVVGELLPLPPQSPGDGLLVGEIVVVTLVYSKSLSDSILIVEQVIVGQFISESILVTETLSFKHALPTQSIIETLTISEVVIRFLQPACIENLFVGETIVGTTNRPNSDNLNVTETVVTQGNVFNISVREELIISEYRTKNVSYGGVVETCQDSFVPVPAIGIRTYTTLSYPIGGSPTITVNLRNPKFGNKQIQDTGRFVRNTKGGDLIIVSSNTWLTLNYLDLEFEKLNIAQATALLTLLETSAADQIQLIDWENRTWLGFIINEPKDVLQMMDDGCQYNATLRFEGTLV